jgi:hypothetical protein
MKLFKVHFISRSSTYSSRDAYLEFQTDTFEHLNPRINRALEQLDKLANPTNHGRWTIDNISEVKQP